MDIINSFKGTLYDLLGYFAPGLVGMICTAITVLRMQSTSDPWNVIINIIKDLKAKEVFVLVVLAYIFGHAIASASSWVIEKNLMKKSEKLKTRVEYKKIVGSTHYEQACLKFKEIFSAEYDEKGERKIISYVETKRPAVYETALVFLSFYGMARNLSFVFGCFALIEILFLFLEKGSILALGVQAVLTGVFLYEYIRFRVYFVDTIFSGFLIAEK